MTINTRDLHADLAICDASTEAPWHTSSLTEGYIIAGDEKCTTIATVIEYNDDGTEYLRLGHHDCQDNRIFIAESRQGWPEAIRRAIAAEASLDKLVRAYIVQDNSRYGIDDFWDVVDSIVNKAAEERVKQGLRLCTECGSEYPPETSVYSNMCKTCADKSDMPAGYWDYDTGDFHYEYDEVD